MKHAYCYGAMLLLLVIGGIAGAFLFPAEKVVTEEVTVEVPVEVVKEVEVIKEVPVQDTSALQAATNDLILMRERLEQVTGDRLDIDDLRFELSKIDEAKDLFVDEYEHKVLRQGYTPSETRIVKIYDEDIDVDYNKEFEVDGRDVEYDAATVSFTAKVEYSDEDGTQFRWFDVEMEYYLNRDGIEKVRVSTSLA